MEGSKSFVEKSQSNESVESLDESIEHALELLTELQTFHNVEVIGGDAMTLNQRAEELALELKEVLTGIPAQDCIENSLPYHPSDIKAEMPTTPLPSQPEYPLSYPVAVSGNGAPATEAA